MRHPTMLATVLLLALAPALFQAQTPLLPSSIAYDVAGNLYFVDTNRHQVFESSLAGALTVVAGSGVQGFSGDNGPATAAALNAPQAIAIAADGTIYLADTGNHRVRTIVSGTITTIAGTGLGGYSGDNGPAITATLHTPAALTIDATGALLVADANNHRIRRIATGQISTIAGTGVQGFFGDNGPAINAQLDTPSGLAIAPDGRIFVSDSHNDRIRVISTVGIITTVAGTGERGYSGDGGPALVGRVAFPHGLLYASGTLVFADSDNHRVRSVDASGTIGTLVGNGIQGASTNASVASAAFLNTPRAVSISAFDAPVFADPGNSTIWELLPDAALYTPAGLTPSRVSNVSLSGTNPTYGQFLGSIAVSGSAALPQGTVQVFEGSSRVAQSALTLGNATISLPTLGGGSHVLTAVYVGDGVNPTATASSTISIARAPTLTLELPLAQNSYAGLPLVLEASVSAVGGTPTGSITFLNGATVLATANLVNGSASALYLSPPSGTNVVTANYSGDTNFAPSVSNSVSTTVNPLPDFTFASVGPISQTVQGGSIAVYSFAVSPQSAPFTGAVSFSVKGLQPGSTAVFSPVQVVPGSSSVLVTLSIQTVALARLNFPHELVVLAILPFAFFRRKRRGRLTLLFLLALTGCGDRTIGSSGQIVRSFPMIVSATSTNLANATVNHTSSISLSIR